MYEEHVNLRTRIENALNYGEIGNASNLVAEYEMLAPKDMELVNYKALLYIYAGNFDSACKVLEEALKQYPLNADINYNLAYVYEQKNNIFGAFEYYTRSRYIYEFNRESEKISQLELNEKVDYLLSKIININEDEISKDFLESLKRLNDRLNTFFGLKNNYFRDENSCIGKEIWFSDEEKRFVALQRLMIASCIPDYLRSLLYSKAEMLKTRKESQYIVNGSEGQKFLIPISTDKLNTQINISENGEVYRIKPNASMHFDYYTVKAGAVIQSDKNVYFGDPIPIGHKSNRKKLVLNLFIDGLSQTILNGEDLRKIMPHTYDFFSKGIICTNAHSSAEWTYPSLATYITGLDIVNHMQYHSSIDGELRKDVTTLAQYFHEAGYYTAKIDGDWRSIPPYGHTRGVDRYIYQNSGFGLKEEQMIGEIIEHLEAFSETDRYLWACLDDLHNIADGLSSPSGVQHLMELEDWEIDEVGETSAKQKYSEKKISRYIKGARHLDVLLNVLYHYIEDNFSDDEIVVSLFADHGQGYLIKNDGHFLGQGRTNVAFMFRGGLTPNITNELISSCDYKSIMCKLARIELNDELSDGNLPKAFGGEKEREWVMAESLHPGDPYYATYYTKDKIFYFENGTNTQSDGRVKIKDYKAFVEDYNGNFIDDYEFRKEYLEIMMKHIEPLLIYED